LNENVNSHIYLNFINIAERVQSACFGDGDCEENFPIKDCTNNFIIISEGEENKIEQDQNCVFIEARSGNELAVIDEFLLKTIGVK
jgi:hypothetical protein